MGLWYGIIVLSALAGLFWLASLSQATMRILMVVWGVCLLLGGVIVLGGIVASLADGGVFDGLLVLVVGGGLGLYLLYGGYRLVSAAVQRWD